MNEPDDSELARKAGAGDAEAFGELIRRHHARVAGLCANLLDSRSDADDAAQEIFVKVHRSLSKFRSDAKFSTWLYRIATNHCSDARKKSKRRRTVSLDFLIEEGGETAGDLLVEQKPKSDMGEQQDLARRLFAELPEVCRAAVSLRTDGMSYEEIAESLQCSLDAVKSRLRRARASAAESLRRLSSPPMALKPIDAGEAA
jgi:RNA polymerase sigma-70 factor (ECF subfamily)